MCSLGLWQLRHSISGKSVHFKYGNWKGKFLNAVYISEWNFKNETVWRLYWDRGPQIFQTSRNHLKIRGASWMTWNKSQTKGTTITNCRHSGDAGAKFLQSWTRGFRGDTKCVFWCPLVFQFRTFFFPLHIFHARNARNGVGSPGMNNHNVRHP